IRRARCGRCQAKSADNTGCLIEHFGNADAVPQLPERCLSRKAGIVRCCLKCLGKGEHRSPAAVCCVYDLLKYVTSLRWH
ncbi:MAG: hypothetical protein MR806_05275, partial [Subdoligranulum sp.]|nr:hypothetical protein [Subdoligranulum sp.]